MALFLLAALIQILAYATMRLWQEWSQIHSQGA